MPQTQGIVLNEIKFKESSKIINIFTRDFGKVNIMAHGAYKAKSKLRPYTQVFTQCDYNLHKGKNWYYINDASIIDTFYTLRERLERTIIGFYIIELLDKSVEKEEKNPLLFELLIKGLDVLSKLDNNYLEFLIAYELKYISFIGFRPSLLSCCNCGEKEIKRFSFSIVLGGILCNQCYQEDLSKISIRNETHKILVSLMYAKLDEIYKFNFKKEFLLTSQKIIENYILYHIDRKRLNSLEMIKTILY